MDTLFASKKDHFKILFCFQGSKSQKDTKLDF